MQCILYTIYFWKVFHMHYNLICILYALLCEKKFYSCKKWVLHHSSADVLLMMNTKICVIPQELRSLKLSSIVRQYSSGHAKSVYDALQERDCCFMRLHHRHWFYPLGECVDSNE
jgi:hypothetical protein